MTETPDAQASLDAAARCWKARVVADGPSSLAARRWPVLLVLTNLDDQPHGFALQAVEQVRLRSPAAGLTLLCELHAPPGPRMRVEPGGELRLPLDLLDHVQQVELLAAGPYRVSLRLRSECGPLRLPATVLQLGP